LKADLRSKGAKLTVRKHDLVAR